VPREIRMIAIKIRLAASHRRGIVRTSPVRARRRYVS
jgi:hypothetical protein